MAPRGNLKKQNSTHQLRTATTTPQTTSSPNDIRSNNSPQAESSRSADPNLQTSPANVDLTSLVDDKLARVLALHARWHYKDTEKQALEGETLQACRRTRCRELGLIIFGFTLHNAQVEEIYTLFYEQRDL